MKKQKDYLKRMGEDAFALNNSMQYNGNLLKYYRFMAMENEQVTPSMEKKYEKKLAKQGFYSLYNEVAAVTNYIQLLVRVILSKSLVREDRFEYSKCKKMLENDDFSVYSKETLQRRAVTLVTAISQKEMVN